MNHLEIYHNLKFIFIGKYIQYEKKSCYSLFEFFFCRVEYIC